MSNVVVEILDNTGTKTAILDREECEAKTSRRLNAEWTVEVRYAIPLEGQGFDKSSYFEAWSSRIRIRDLDAGTYETFIVTRSQLRHLTNGAKELLAFGEHQAILDMNNEIVEAELDLQNVTPAAALAKLLAYSTNWSPGTVTPTDKISVLISYERVIVGLQRILSACGGEWDVDEAAGQIDIAAQLGADNNVSIRPGRNMESLARTQFSRDVVNKIFGVGGGTPPATIKGARHVVGSYAAGVLTTEGNKVVPEDDSWNTSWQVRMKTGAQAGNAYTINDCTAGASQDTLTMAGAPAGIAAGDRFVIEEVSGSVEVGYILAGTSISTYGEVQDVHKDQRYLDITNLLQTPALDGTYTGGLCQDWTNEGGTLSENTTAAYIQYGSKSQRIQGAADADGVSQQITIINGNYYRILAWVYITSGTVKLQVSDGTTTWETSLSGTGWQRFSISDKMASATMTVKVIQNGAGTSDFYVDAVQVTDGILERTFVVNSDLKSLWDLAYNSLIDRKDPRIEYVANFVDLHRMDPLAYPYDQVSLGDTVTIYDEELGIDGIQARVKMINEDRFRPELTRHTVSNY